MIECKIFKSVDPEQHVYLAAEINEYLWGLPAVATVVHVDTVLSGSTFMVTVFYELEMRS